MHKDIIVMVSVYFDLLDIKAIIFSGFDESGFIVVIILAS